jgi:NAD(P)-dependent dehydrogenase (short-subunit alcohol dehydrogenase family)
MDLGLTGHLALLTGAAGGIGRAAAELFAAEGARVAIWDLSPQGADTAAAIASQYGGEAAAWQVDVTDSAAVTEAAEAVEARFGAIGHLVHAAAIGSGKFGFPFSNLKPADWPRVLEVNIMGMVNVAHAVGPAMAQRGAGTMVFLASVAGQIGSQTDPPYSAAKAANINFAQCLAKDLAPNGVRVNTVCPGMVQTALNRSVWQAWHDQAPAAERRSYDQWAGEKVAAVVPLGRWQTPAAIADMIVFLSSERAAHVTGQTVNVDGGWVMHW